LGGFAIGAQVSLLWQHSAEREMSASACTCSMPGVFSALSLMTVQQEEHLAYKNSAHIHYGAII